MYSFKEYSYRNTAATVSRAANTTYPPESVFSRINVLVLDLEKARRALNELKCLSVDACDTLECRIEAVLEKMASVELCVLPTDEPLTVDEFLAATEAHCTQAAETLTKSVYSRRFKYTHALKYSGICEEGGRAQMTRGLKQRVETTCRKQ